MLLSGWNLDDAKRVWQREEREDTFEEVLDLIKKGYTTADIENHIRKQTHSAHLSAAGSEAH